MEVFVKSFHNFRKLHAGQRRRGSASKVNSVTDSVLKACTLHFNFTDQSFRESCIRRSADGIEITIGTPAPTKGNVQVKPERLSHL